MASLLKSWRRERREDGYWCKARQRSRTLREAEIVESIDLALMSGGQVISRYRQGYNKEDQLYELRLNLEAALGMLDNLMDDYG